MRPTVHISFGPAEVVVPLSADDTPWSPEQARRWLDAQFVARECEPARASGKVLTVDKVLGVAAAIGRQGFETDEALRHDFARAAAAALDRPVVRIDVEGRTVSS